MATKKRNYLYTMTDIAVGTLSSWIHILAGYPLDFIKTRMQVYSSQYKTAWEYFRHIVRNEGFFTLYRGISSPLMGSIFTGSIFFSSYEFAKRKFALRNNKPLQNYLPLHQVFLSGSFAVSLIQSGRVYSFQGMMADTLNIPMEFAKIQIQVYILKKKFPNKTATQIHTRILIVATWTYWSANKSPQKKRVSTYLQVFTEYHYYIQRGTPLQLMRNFVGVGSFFTSHDFVLRSCTPVGKTRKDVPQWGMMAAGAAAGFSFWTVAYPIDMIKTRVQADNVNNPKHAKIRGYIKELYKEGGVRQFYKGYKVSVMRSMFTNFLQLYVYENLHKLAYSYQKFE